MADEEVYYHGPIISRAEAKQKGLKLYFTGKPCIKGHIAQRYASSGCVVCSEVQRTSWREINLDYHKKLQSDWFHKNKDHHREYGRNWSASNKDKRKIYAERWREKNKDRYLDAKRKWKESNPDKVKEHDIRRSRKRSSDLKYRISCRIRRSIWKALKSGKPSTGSSKFKCLGYMADDLIRHLNKSMPKGYTWDDFMNGKLHIDHIIPVSVFNFDSVNDADFKRCWSLNNLQLLPASENCSKGAKLDKPFQPSLKGF